MHKNKKFIKTNVSSPYNMKQLELWMFLICFALRFDSSEGNKCCVSRAYAVCWVTPNFWENALTDEKKNNIVKGDFWAINRI